MIMATIKLNNNRYKRGVWRATTTTTKADDFGLNQNRKKKKTETILCPVTERSKKNLQLKTKVTLI